MRVGILIGVLRICVALHAAEPRHEMIPMRDGIKLSAYITLPDGPGPFPTILIRTPYTIEPGQSAYRGHGYAIVQQNLRGLFRSEGKWPLFANEMRDGYDTVEWIAQQPWSNGKVGVSGGSGPGIAGYMTLMSGAPHLAAGVVQNAHASDYSTVSYPGGVYQAGLLDSWIKARGLEIPPEFPRPLIRRFDSYYALQDVSTHASKISAPILHLTGWFDIFTQGTIDYFKNAQTKGTGHATNHQKLIIRPTGHGEILPGELQWPGDLPRLNDLPRRWFDFWLRGIDTGVQKMPPVQYFVMGDPKTKMPPGNVWKSSRAWPPNANTVSFYLQPEGGLSRIAPAHPNGSSSFDYDPLDPVPSVVPKKGDWLNRAPLDQRILHDRADILRFTSRPLTEPVEIAGDLNAEIWVSTTARDTDFFVRLIDIYPNGFEALMAAQPMRLRFRDGFDKMLPAQRNRIYMLTVNLWPLAMVFAKGHRIGVQITSSDVPRFDRHSNTWDPVKRYEDAVKATNTVHYSSQHPSRLILPVVRRAPER
jgi:predicted acyl esterase